MNEQDFKRLYQCEFPSPINDAYEAHNHLADKMALSKNGMITGCTSYIQRKMSCGYNHAAAIMELMEEKGAITPADDRGRRRLMPFPRSDGQ